MLFRSGDFSWAIKSEDAESDFALFKELKGKKVILRGNHDFWWNTISQVRAILPENFFAIQNDAFKFGNLIVCGSRGWVLPEPNRPLNERDNKIYLREIERIKLSLAAMEKLRQEGDRVICIMHYPPFNGRREESEFSVIKGSAPVAEMRGYQSQVISYTKEIGRAHV